VSPHLIQLFGIAPLAFLFLDPEAPTPLTAIALFALLITTAAGLVGRYLDNQRDKQRYEREEKRYELDREERLTNAAGIHTDLLVHREVLKAAIAEHTSAAAAQVEAVRSSLSTEHAVAITEITKAKN
jgi:hypothetical protein